MSECSESMLAGAGGWLGRVPYHEMWSKMREQAELVNCSGRGELIWLCEHEPVYTTGKRGIDNRSGASLPAELVRTDRGGETTFHGPGQLMLYPVISLRRRGVGVKQYVRLLEASCIELLAGLQIQADRRCGFPGVWTKQGKIAALGVRVQRGVAYHGMALNVAVDSNWFAAINPCGLQSGVVNISDYGEPPALPALAKRWQASFLAALPAG